ncbi:hypothetical protein CVT24_013056 [Panaeolus cyanescens]|uniref:Transmembrane protein 188 n=1 Tax=Panaeolus cyanescens TaxID=181874 RepID=A0A409YUV3_9AGAR|nr:hypothetical protein CVT24_013056 [Panaeolus cyanescens]
MSPVAISSNTSRTTSGATLLDVNKANQTLGSLSRQIGATAVRNTLRVEVPPEGWTQDDWGEHQLRCMGMDKTWCLEWKPDYQQGKTQVSEHPHKLWTEEMFYRHLDFLDKHVARSKAASLRPWINAFLYRACYIIKTRNGSEHSMKFSADPGGVPFSNSREKFEPVPSRYVYWTVISYRKADGHLFSALERKETYPCPRSVFCVSECEGPERITQNDVSRALARMDECMRVARVSNIRGAVTNGVVWRFLILERDQDGGGVYSESPDIDTCASLCPQSPRHGTSVVLLQLADWILQSQSVIHSLSYDDKFFVPHSYDCPWNFNNDNTEVCPNEIAFVRLAIEQLDRQLAFGIEDLPNVETESNDDPRSEDPDLYDLCRWQFANLKREPETFLLFKPEVLSALEQAPTEDVMDCSEPDPEEGGLWTEQTLFFQLTFMNRNVSGQICSSQGTLRLWTEPIIARVATMIESRTDYRMFLDFEQGSPWGSLMNSSWHTSSNYGHWTVVLSKASHGADQNFLLDPGLSLGSRLQYLDADSIAFCITEVPDIEWDSESAAALARMMTCAKHTRSPNRADAIHACSTFAEWARHSASANAWLMPPRSGPRGSFVPPADNATYSDLLRFEERLKTTAANLQRRKSKYQLFLFQLIAAIIILLIEVLLPPDVSILVIPYKWLLQQLGPDFYKVDQEILLHPYIATGLLFISVTTLVLFFASGLYSEKIAYANKYVPHANRALRPFNMFLNVKKPPLRSKFIWNPLSFFFPRPDQPHTSSDSRTISRSPSPSGNRSRSASTTRPIPTIPPAVNPRGELIFSSKVDRNFRESYERYRANFERRREEKAFAERKKTWYGKLAFWERAPSPVSAGVGAGGDKGSGGSGASAPPSRTASISSRGKVSRSATPPATPDQGIVMKQKERSGSPMQRASSSSNSTTSSSSAPRERLRRQDSSSMRTAVLERTLGHHEMPAS